MTQRNERPSEAARCLNACHRSIQRPAELATDTASMLAVVQHAMSCIPGSPEDIWLLVQPTQPFRTPDHLREAVRLLRETEADAVVTVTELPPTHSPLMVCAIDSHTGRLWPWLSDHEYQEGDGYISQSWSGLPTRRQAVEPVFKRDGTCYAFYRRTVKRHNSLYGQHVVPLIIPPEQSCELDTEADWQAVEERFRKLQSHAT